MPVAQTGKDEQKSAITFDRSRALSSFFRVTSFGLRNTIHFLKFPQNRVAAGENSVSQFFRLISLSDLNRSSAIRIIKGH